MYNFNVILNQFKLHGIKNNPIYKIIICKHLFYFYILITKN